MIGTNRFRASWRGRIRDFGLYIFISVAIAAAVLIYLPYSHPSDEDAIAKWGGLAGNTLILFGYTIAQHRHLRRTFSFWVCLIILLFVHLSILIPVLWRVDHWRIVWFVPMYLIEAPLVDFVAAWVTRRFLRTGPSRVARTG
jgi:hypothetical protein